VKLLEIGDEFRALDALLAEAAWDANDVTQESLEAMQDAHEALSKWFDELSTGESQKIDNYRAYIRTLERDIAVAQSLEDQYRKERKTREGRIEWLKGRMKAYLELRGKDRIVTDTLGEVKLQTNGGKLPIVPEGWADGLDPATIDSQFRKLAVNTEAVRAALEGGEELPFAKLGERGKHIRLK